MIKCQIVCGDTAALNITCRLQEAFEFGTLDIYHLEGDSFLKCYLREATKIMSHVEA